jgi:CRISPR/Cas system CMR subunit Cmr6 (Cas7 group RAMP superfamily)
MSGFGILAHPGLRYGSGINAELLRTRLWHGDIVQDRISKNEPQQTAHLQLVAAAAKDLPPTLLPALHARRWAAMVALADRQTDHRALSLVITPHWRFVVGHGENSPHETSLSFSTTYGVPIWPASGIKGVTAAHARAVGVSNNELGRVFGTPRPGDSGEVLAHQGAVTVLDALPVKPPTVMVDVLTPHVKPYYDDAIRDPQRITHPPAEYHNPVPVRFLAVGATPFRTLVVGPAADAARFAELLCVAVDDLGLGGKTAAGYGYCTAHPEHDGPVAADV